MSDDERLSRKEMLRELESLGVNIRMLEETNFSDDELRAFLDAIRSLLKRKRR